jgi:hypothetical protein
MVVKNPTPEVPTNNKNNLVFKQIQTVDYELQKIQKNVQALSSDVTQAVNNSVTIIASQPNPKSYTLTILNPITLFFPKAKGDLTKSYNEVDSVFTAPNAGVFQCTLNGSFNITVGAPNALFVYLKSNIRGVLSKSQAPVISNIAYFNLCFVVNLDNNERLSFTASSAVNPTTAKLSNDSRVSFNSVG